MSITSINAVGKVCPVPVIEAKKALAENGCDGVLICVDNMTAVQNLEKLADSQGCAYSYKQAGENRYEVSLLRSGASVAENLPGLPVSGVLTAIGRDTMGEGDEELGRILIKGFIYALAELDAPPSHVIFFNSGARLTVEGANTVGDLKRLEARGTKIMTCGTCLNYYKLSDSLAVGTVANMYEITAALTEAAKVINI